MGRAAKYGIVALLCGASLLVGVVSGWWLRGPVKGTAQLLKLLAENAPIGSTDADWRAVTATKETVKVCGLDMVTVTLNNIRPILEAEGNTSANHLCILNTREGSGPQTRVWGAKANNAFQVDWATATVSKIARPDLNTPFYLGAERQASSTRFKNDYYILGYPHQEVIITTPGGKKRSPWPRDSGLAVLYCLRGYRFGAILETNEQTGKALSLVVIDLDNAEVAAIIPLPPQSTQYGPQFLIDPTTDLLLCLDTKIAWIVCVDLRLSIDQSKKPWPPPWPHPALGPWHGNNDVLNGRFTQLPEGVPVPPRPPDYP